MKKIRLPIGHCNFNTIVENEFDLVDKSLFIKDVIDDLAQVILITRPRRFGKTINMSMLQCFFSDTVDGRSTHQLFNNFKISKEEKLCLQHQGQYPVIFLTFKDIKQSSFESTYFHICRIITELYLKHDYLLSSDKISTRDKSMYHAIVNGSASPADMASSLQALSKYLYLHHGKGVIILIDEYDTPIQLGYFHDYYDQVMDFFRHFFGEALKGNSYIFKAILTGILRVSKESLFSGLNNIKTYSMLSDKFSDYFGFTHKEVLNLLNAADYSDTIEVVKKWYNGYIIGSTILYNPWSIVNFLADRTFQPYWINTSDNALIAEIILNSDDAFKDQLEQLVQGKKIVQAIDENMVYADLSKNIESAVWSFLLMTGYLKAARCHSMIQSVAYEFSIPNFEILGLYQKMIQEWMSGGRGVMWHSKFIDSLLNGDVIKFSENLTQIMQQTVSVHDVAMNPEAFYHGFILGLTASLHGHPNYELRSNRESGYGRYDYLIISKDPSKISILMEFKRKNGSVAVLKKTAEDALQQIENQQYFSELRQRGINNMLQMGIAFSGKKVVVAHKHSLI